MAVIVGRERVDRGGGRRCPDCSPADQEGAGQPGVGAGVEMELILTGHSGRRLEQGT